MRAKPELSDAEREDLEFIAEQRGWSFEEAVSRIGWQRGFDEAVAEFRSRYPDTFAGAVITPEGLSPAFIGFVGEVPEAVRADVRVAGIGVDFRSHRSVSEGTLLAQLDAVHGAIRGAGYPDVMTEADVETGTIEVQLPVGSISVPPEWVIAGLPAVARSPNVNLHLVEELPGALHTLSGGATMTTCTAGFNVRQGTTRGVLTAGHCGDAQSMIDDFGVWRALTFQAEHRGAFGDFQWHTHATVPFTTFFQFNTGLRREVWSVGTASKGRTICRFGRTTGLHCDEVYKVNVSSGPHDRLAMMRNRNADGGDSGGPWYFGNTAFGVHSGGKTSWFKMRDVWSQLTNVGSALGVTVLRCEPPRTTCQPWECGSVSIGCGQTLWCGSCGGCTSEFDCYDESECGWTGGSCFQGSCFCF